MTDDEPVVLVTDAPLRMTADGMRALKKATGRTMSDMDDDEADRLQAMAFFELHRRGVRLGHLADAGTLWERAGAVDIDFEGPDRLDPTADAP